MTHDPLSLFLPLSLPLLPFSPPLSLSPARVYHRRGARRWRKVRRINGHAFVAKRLQVMNEYTYTRLLNVHVHVSYYWLNLHYITLILSFA